MTTLREAVNQLPHTVDGVRDFFIEHHVKGIRSEAMLCPLAIYLTEQTGHRVVVGLSTAWPKVGHGDDDAVELPGYLVSFINEFDSNMLPGSEALLV